MSNVSNILEASKEETLIAAGEAVCGNCKHQWVAIKPASYERCLECPECHTMHGHFKWPYGATPGQLSYTCNCGSEDFFIMRKNFAAIAAVYCRGCGYEATSWFN